jgi:hypothetical protein
MLHQTNPKVIDCLNNAAEARRMHDATTDPDARFIYLQIEQSWHTLANSHAFLAQLEHFIKQQGPAAKLLGTRWPEPAAGRPIPG